MRRFLRFSLGLALAFLVHTALAPAFALELGGQPIQGGYMIGKVDRNKQVMLNGQEVPKGPDGLFIIGFGRDFGEEAKIEIVRPNGTREERIVRVQAREYDTQSITGVAPKYVQPPEEVLTRIAEDIHQVKRARTKMTPVAWFEDGFGWPLFGTITGVYGSQRIFNGEPRRPHFGIDIAAPTGAEVRAASTGVVSLAHPDMYYSGGTIIIDHGYGLNTTYLHLSKLSVRDGDIVERGDVIGYVGSTGRSTGPHLDVRLNWFQERLDFQLAAGEMIGRPN